MKPRNILGIALSMVLAAGISSNWNRIRPYIPHKHEIPRLEQIEEIPSHVEDEFPEELIKEDYPPRNYPTNSIPEYYPPTNSSSTNKPILFKRSEWTGLT